MHNPSPSRMMRPWRATGGARLPHPAREGEEMSKTMKVVLVGALLLALSAGMAAA